ncbi:MAG: HEAT repeat domain-containing protein [Calditrichaeota bacterium]|nr:HEAT repeat domain-containing protein [Calditrichota bacterium]
MGNHGDSEIRQLLETLGSKNGMERRKAREELAAMGKEAIDSLKELLDHPKRIYRWEALKTMVEIGDPVSIPLFIQALEDDEGDVRWIAAEGLIKMGSQSIIPLLKTLVERSDYIFVLVGAHHVFYNLKKAKELPADFPIDKLLSALKSSGWKGSVKPLAYELLNSLEY